jgi:crotonobetainyl-CoA:carnitine CoA-transferase CaiB-like acyl-CoA transferase
MTLPLADVRVLSVEQFGAGPWATMQLADLGADVIKIEDPGTAGDIGRYVPPFQEGEDSLFFESFNRNKRSISLDLRTAEGQAVLHDLVREVDVVFCNLRGDVPDRLGLGYAALGKVNPKIVCCSLTGFGRTGPRAAQAAYDYVLQGLAGWMSLTGDPDGPPTKSGLSLVDLSAGYVAAIAAIAGLWRARRDGVGCDCDVSLFETALAELVYVGTWAASREHHSPRRPNSAHPSLVPFQNFPTADGWVVVACPKEKFWRRLCDAIGRPELSADERFETFADRDRNRELLLPLLEETFRGRSTDHWVELLTAQSVPCAPVNDAAAALADPQVAARDDIVSYEHPRLGTVRQIATALRVGDEPLPMERAPFRGEHTSAVLAELLGYDAERIRALHEAAVVGNGAGAAAAHTDGGDAVAPTPAETPAASEGGLA